MLTSNRGRDLTPGVIYEARLLSILTQLSDELYSDQFGWTSASVHDTINRYLRGEKLTPRLLWDNVEHHIQVDEDGSIILMILLLIKTSNCIELVRRQYSGTEQIRGIGLISCVYVNVKTGQFW